MWQAILPALLATRSGIGDGVRRRFRVSRGPGGELSSRRVRRRRRISREARDFVRRARLASPSLALALRGADLAAAAGDTDDEARLLEIAAKEAPELLSPAERLVLARQAEARGDRRGAILQYGHVLAALQRRGRSGADWIGENIRRLDAEDEARKLPARPGFSPPSADARRAFADGKAALRRGTNEAAREAFRRALRLSPGYSEAALALGSVEERIGRTADAAAAYRTALAAEPDGFEALDGPLESALERARPYGEGGLARAFSTVPWRFGRTCRAFSARRRTGGPPGATRRARSSVSTGGGRSLLPGERTEATSFRERLRARLARPSGPEPVALGSDPASPAVGAFRLAQVYAGRPDTRDWDAAEVELGGGRAPRSRLRAGSRARGRAARAAGGPGGRRGDLEARRCDRPVARGRVGAAGRASGPAGWSRARRGERLGACGPGRLPRGSLRARPNRVGGRTLVARRVALPALPRGGGRRRPCRGGSGRTGARGEAAGHAARRRSRVRGVRSPGGRPLVGEEAHGPHARRVAEARSRRNARRALGRGPPVSRGVQARRPASRRGGGAPELARGARRGRAAPRRAPLRDAGDAGARRRGAKSSLRSRVDGTPPWRSPEPAIQGPASLPGLPVSRDPRTRPRAISRASRRKARSGRAGSRS